LSIDIPRAHRSRVTWLGAAGVAAFLSGTMTTPSQADFRMPTAAEIRAVSPKANSALVQALIADKEQYTRIGIDSPLIIAHFIAQVMTETGGLERLDEKLSYSQKRAIEVFSRAVLPAAKAAELAGRPRQFANWVYGNRLGNRGRDTDDGWMYRGSGYIQLTGRTNFRNRGFEIRMPLEDDPDLARKPNEGRSAALAYWDAARINRPANDNDIRRVRVLVNGPAAHGLATARYWFSQIWTKIYRAQASPLEAGSVVVPPPDDPALIDALLNENGYLPGGLEAGTDPAQSREEAVKSFQRDVGASETGVLDENTLYDLLDAWRLRDIREPAPPRPESLGEQSISFALAGGSGSAESTPIPTDAVQGSGQTVADVQIRQEDQAALAGARAKYADYEMGAARTNPDLWKPFSVIPPDTRTAVQPTTDFPARAIVQILFEDRSGKQFLCSGTMISVDTVLTAGHCIHSGTVNGRAYSNFRVTPGRNGGAAPFGRCTAVRAFALSGWTSATTEEESRNFDLGALKLDCDVGQRTGWVGVRAVSEKEKDKGTIVQGYASDSAPPGVQMRSDGTLQVIQSLKGFYDNDTFGGTSGAGVFLKDGPDQLVGVHTNGIVENGELPWSKLNAFTLITAERLARIQEWIGK
jgi:predicted chitinase/V8-like Glu-specific endopeptidase